MLQLGGVTLTTSVLYLSLVAHQRARAQQGRMLGQQTFLLATLTDRDLLRPAHRRRHAQEPSSHGNPSRAHRHGAAARALDYLQRPPAPGDGAAGGVVQTLKSRWNAEVAGAVAAVHTADWPAVAARAEQGIITAWQGVRDAVSRAGRGD